MLDLFLFPDTPGSFSAPWWAGWRLLPSSSAGGSSSTAFPTRQRGEQYLARATLGRNGSPQRLQDRLRMYFLRLSIEATWYFCNSLSRRVVLVYAVKLVLREGVDGQLQAALLNEHHG